MGVCQNAKQPLICTGEATAAGMPHLGVAMHYPPGPRDTTRVYQEGGRALPSEHRVHAAGKRPDGDLEAENLVKGIEKEQTWRQSHDARGDLPKNDANDDHVARKVTAARMQHPGVVVRRRPGQRHTIPHHAASGRALPSELGHHRHPNMAGRRPFSATPAALHRMQIRS